MPRVITKVQNMLEGYSGEKFARAVKKILLCSVEVIKKSDLHTFKVKALDCRTHCWLENKSQTLVVNVNFLLQNKCPFLPYSRLF